MSTKVVYVIPVSGPYFPLQLAELYRVRLTATDTPDLVMCSSGGSIAAVIGSSSNWTASSILANSEKIAASDFIKKVSPIVPNIFNWLLTGIMYVPSRTIPSSINTLISNMSTSTELLIGTSTKENGDEAVFSTKTAGSGSSFSGSAIKRATTNQQIYRAIAASCSIPHATPGVKIDDTVYQDGGLYAPSPATTQLWDYVSNHLSTAGYKIKIVYYVSSTKPTGTIDALNPVMQMIHSSCSRETILMERLFKSLVTGSVTERTYTDVSAATAVYAAANNALMIISPRLSNYSFDLFSFTGKHVKQITSDFQSFSIKLFSTT